MAVVRFDGIAGTSFDVVWTDDVIERKCGMEKKLFEVVVVDTTNDAILIDVKVMATDEQNAILKACHGMVWNKEESVVMVRPFRK